MYNHSSFNKVVYNLSKTKKGSTSIVVKEVVSFTQEDDTKFSVEIHK